MPADEGFVQFQCVTAPFDDLIEVFPQGIAVLDRQVLVNAAWHAQPRMNAPAARRGDHLLAELADENRPLAHLGEGFDHADDVPLRDRRLKPEQKVGRRQVEEVHRVGLQHLTVMHQPPHLVRRWRHLVHTRDDIHRLGGAKVMTDRADAAETLDDDGNLPVHSSLDETLESTKFNDGEPGLFDLAGLVEANSDLAVTFHTGDRIDDDLPRTLTRLARADVNLAHSYLHRR